MKKIYLGLLMLFCVSQVQAVRFIAEDVPVRGTLIMGGYGIIFATGPTLCEIRYDSTTATIIFSTNTSIGGVDVSQEFKNVAYSTSTTWSALNSTGSALTNLANSISITSPTFATWSALSSTASALTNEIANRISQGNLIGSATEYIFVQLNSTGSALTNLANSISITSPTFATWSALSSTASALTNEIANRISQGNLIGSATEYIFVQLNSTGSALTNLTNSVASGFLAVGNSTPTFATWSALSSSASAVTNLANAVAFSTTNLLGYITYNPSGYSVDVSTDFSIRNLSQLFLYNQTGSQYTKMAVDGNGKLTVTSTNKIIDFPATTGTMTLRVLSGAESLRFINTGAISNIYSTQNLSLTVGNSTANTSTVSVAGIDFLRSMYLANISSLTFTNPGRFIYDNPANYKICVSTNFCIGGDLTLGSGTLYASTYTYSTGTFWTAGSIKANEDNDGTCIFGRTRIGSIITDGAGFAHYDRTANTDYALTQNTRGETILNAPASRWVTFGSGGLEKWRYGNLDIVLGSGTAVCSTYTFSTANFDIGGDGNFAGGDITLGNANRKISDNVNGISFGTNVVVGVGSILMANRMFIKWATTTGNYVSVLQCYDNNVALDAPSGGTVSIGPGLERNYKFSNTQFTLENNGGGIVSTYTVSNGNFDNAGNITSLTGVFKSSGSTGIVIDSVGKVYLTATKGIYGQTDDSYFYYGGGTDNTSSKFNLSGKNRSLEPNTIVASLASNGWFEVSDASNNRLFRVDNNSGNTVWNSGSITASTMTQLGVFKPAYGIQYPDNTVQTSTNTNGGNKTRSMYYKAGGCTLPSVGAAKLLKDEYLVSATSAPSYYVAFDDSVKGYIYYDDQVMDSQYNNGTISIYIKWTSSASVTGNVMWVVDFSTSDNFRTDCYASNSNAFTASAAPSTAWGITTSTLTIAVPYLSPGKFYKMRIYRNADSGSDTMYGDAWYLVGRMEHQVN